MSKDYLGYEAMMNAAMDAAARSVVREALRRVQNQALIGNHHFYISFKTQFPGVDIPDFLREQYPDEMTIVIQHQFWGLDVQDDHFEVTLTFRKLPAELVIPFAALTSFADPSVQFGLQFKTELDPSAVQPAPAAPAGAAPEPAAEKPPAPGEVVSLDSFRKK